ncbi:MAG: ABC transporter substrate-binding protein [Paeniglutamicibacter sp.]
MSTNRTKFLALAAVSALALTVTACGNGGSSADAAETIKVGVIGDFSAGSADMGIAMRQGVEIATEQFNDAGGVAGRDIELVTYDDEGDAQKATTGAQFLTDREKVTAVIGNPNTGTAIATVKTTNARGVPQIVPIAQSPEVLAGDPKYAFRTSATNPLDIKVLVEYAKAQGWEKVGLLHDTSAYGLSGSGLLEEQIPASGLELVGTERYEVGAADLTAQALSLRDAGAEAVLMWSLGADGARFATNAKGIGWDVPLLGGRGLLFNIFGESGGTSVEGTFATGAFDKDKAEAVEFTEKLKEKFDTDDSIDFALLGYDGARVLFDAMKRAGTEKAGDRDAVRDALEQTTDFPLVSGQDGATVNFAPDDHEGADEHSIVVVQYGADGWGSDGS